MTRSDWLDRMALRFEHDPHGFVLALYNGQVAALLAAGVDAMVAVAASGAGDVLSVDRLHVGGGGADAEGERQDGEG
jgi:hypothetical protein